MARPRPSPRQHLPVEEGEVNKPGDYAWVCEAAARFPRLACFAFFVEMISCVWEGAGINPVLHCDGNWDLELEALREVPAGNCVVQFDGPADIFPAKRVIGDCVCIMGGVHP